MQIPPPLPIGPDLPWLAPLAGFSDLPFRLLCKQYGAAVCCTEMVSAKGLIYGLKQYKQKKSAVPCTNPHLNLAHHSGTEDLLSTTQEDNPVVVQLFGEDPTFLAESIMVLRERGFAYFDLNMGCSVPKVTKTGAGAAMLTDLNNAVTAAKAMVKAAGTGLVGCKIRLGWQVGENIALELSLRLQDAGVHWLTLHPRYAKQGFTGQAAWPELERLRHAIQIPLIASGDLFTAQDAFHCITQTNVSGVMFARGALSNPSIFKQYRQLRNGQPLQLPSHAEMYHMIQTHTSLAKTHTPGKPGKKGMPPALAKMRTIVPRYVRHLPQSKQLRLALTRCTSWEELEHLIHEFFLAPQIN